MCGIVVDAVVLIGLVMALNQEDPPGLFKSVMAALAIAVVGGLGMYGVAAISPLLALILIPLLLAIAAGFVLWVIFDTPPAKAAIGGGVFAFYKLVFVFIVAWMFSTPAG
ncbi:MAG TPA: hypothetical protein VFB96_01435 [Pirellulaceae bacterium]|nr:hypothetical protein [Pirellulaceae bacterium]